MEYDSNGYADKRLVLSSSSAIDHFVGTTKALRPPLPSVFTPKPVARVRQLTQEDIFVYLTVPLLILNQETEIFDSISDIVS